VFLDCSPNVLGPATHTFKRCSRCGEFKPRDMYFRDKSRRDGLNPDCKPCASQEVKAWREKNKERTSATSKALYERTKECKAAQAKTWYQANKESNYAYVKVWREKNKEHHTKTRQAHYEANREVYAAQNKAWADAHPEKTKTYKHRYRARKMSLPSTFTSSDFRIALDYFGNCCATCGRQLNGLFHTDHLDHWVPLVAIDCPGTVPHNMVPLCSTCNLSKQDTPANEWLITKFGKRKGAAILRRVETFLNSRKLTEGDQA
jgi:hypothetical protein